MPRRELLLVLEEESIWDIVEHLFERNQVPFFLMSCLPSWLVTMVPSGEARRAVAGLAHVMVLAVSAVIKLRLMYSSTVRDLESRQD